MNDTSHPELQVWIAEGPASEEMLARFKNTLSPPELEQAARFHFDIHRRRHILAHGLLRQVLAECLSLEPAQLEFGVTAFGKPFLLHSDLQFNMSHSEEYVAIAVIRGRQIGIDVEFIRTFENMDTIAAQHFTPNEQRLLDSPRMFFTNWTRKEAYIKAVGKGLSIPLNSFDTSMASGAAGTRLPSTPDSPLVESWWLSDLTLPSEYAGAIVVEGGYGTLKSNEIRLKLR